MFFLSEYGVMNKTKGSPADEQAIASGTQDFLCCLVGESVAEERWRKGKISGQKGERNGNCLSVDD